MWCRSGSDKTSTLLLCATAGALIGGAVSYALSQQRHRALEARLLQRLNQSEERLRSETSAAAETARRSSPSSTVSVTFAVWQLVFCSRSSPLPR